MSRVEHRGGASTQVIIAYMGYQGGVGGVGRCLYDACRAVKSGLRLLDPLPTTVLHDSPTA